MPHRCAVCEEPIPGTEDFCPGCGYEIALAIGEPVPNAGYPFCPVPGSNRHQEPGFDFCASHIPEKDLAGDIFDNPFHQLANLDSPLVRFRPTSLEQVMSAKHAAGECGWGCPVCAQEERQK
jgi:hypothetical protein